MAPSKSYSILSHAPDSPSFYQTQRSASPPFLQRLTVDEPDASEDLQFIP